MSDNKKYYYFRLTENFFDTESMIVLEGLQDGYLYSNILLKLYAKSLKGEGRLMLNDRIPYDTNMLARITRHSVGVVEKALKAFEELELIIILDTGAIYMSDIQNFIGQSSTEADRKRAYRARIESEKTGILPMVPLNKGDGGFGQMSGQMSGQISDKYPTNLHQSIEYRDKSIEIEKEINIVSKDTISPTDVERVIAVWNRQGVNQIKGAKSGTQRHKMLTARLRQYGFESFLEAIDNVRKSSFLQGQNDRSWMITFDWFLKPNNFIKVLEGNYTDRGWQDDDTTVRTSEWGESEEEELVGDDW